MKIMNWKHMLLKLAGFSQTGHRVRHPDSLVKNENQRMATNESGLSAKLVSKQEKRKPYKNEKGNPSPLQAEFTGDLFPSSGDAVKKELSAWKSMADRGDTLKRRGEPKVEVNDKQDFGSPLMSEKVRRERLEDKEELGKGAEPTYKVGSRYKSLASGVEVEIQGFGTFCKFKPILKSGKASYVDPQDSKSRAAADNDVVISYVRTVNGENVITKVSDFERSFKPVKYADTNPHPFVDDEVHVSDMDTEEVASYKQDMDIIKKTLGLPMTAVFEDVINKIVELRGESMSTHTSFKGVSNTYVRCPNCGYDTDILNYIHNDVDSQIPGTNKVLCKCPQCDYKFFSDDEGDTFKTDNVVTNWRSNLKSLADIQGNEVPPHPWGIGKTVKINDHQGIIPLGTEGIILRSYISPSDDQLKYKVRIRKPNFVYNGVFSKDDLEYIPNGDRFSSTIKGVVKESGVDFQQKPDGTINIEVTDPVPGSQMEPIDKQFPSPQELPVTGEPPVNNEVPAAQEPTGDTNAGGGEKKNKKSSAITVGSRVSDPQLGNGVVKSVSDDGQVIASFNDVDYITHVSSQITVLE